MPGGIAIRSQSFLYTLTPERSIGVGESASTLIRYIECDWRNTKEDLKHDDRLTDRDDLARYRRSIIAQGSCAPVSGYDC